MLGHIFRRWIGPFLLLQNSFLLNELDFNTYVFHASGEHCYVSLLYECIYLSIYLFIYLFVVVQVALVIS